MKTLHNLVLISFLVCVFIVDKANAQTEDLVFKSYLLSANEALANNNLEKAIRDYSKARELENNDRAFDLLQLRLKIFVVQDDYIKAEEEINWYSKSYDTKRLNDIQDFIDEIRFGAKLQRVKVQDDLNELYMWESAKANSYDGLRKYIDSYPNGKYTDGAKKLYTKYLFKDGKLDDEDYKYYFVHNINTIDLDKKQDVHILVTDKFSNLGIFNNLILAAVVNAQIIVLTKEYAKELNKNSKLLDLRFSDCNFYLGVIDFSHLNINIKRLFISNTNLKEISKLNLPKISALTIQKSDLINMPSIKFPEVIKTLDLSKNKITKIDESIRKMNNIEQLNLDNNLIKEIPISIKNCSKLKQIVISNNPINTLNKDFFSYFSELEILYIHGLQLKSFPNGIEKLSGLKSLSLDGNLGVLPNGIEKLEKLENLYVFDLSPVRSQFSLENLRRLKTLHLDGNIPPKVLDDLAKLRRISDLKLSNADLLSIPSSVYEMTNLKSLDLSGNKRLKLDERVLDLNYLESLDLSETPVLSFKEMSKFRMELPRTTIKYYNPFYNQNMESLPLSKELESNMLELLLYIREGDLQSTFELGQLFEQNKDYGLAFYCYNEAFNNKILKGRGKLLINHYALAKLYEKLENKNSDFVFSGSNLTTQVDNYCKVRYVQELELICKGIGTDESGRQITNKACYETLEYYKKVLGGLVDYKNKLLDEIDILIPGAKSRLEASKDWVELGNIAEMSFNLGGYGALAGQTLGLISGFSAQSKQEKAKAVKNQLSNLQKSIDMITDKINSL